MFRLIALTISLCSFSFAHESLAQLGHSTTTKGSSIDSPCTPQTSPTPMPIVDRISIHAFYLTTIEVGDESMHSVTWNLGFQAFYDGQSGLRLTKIQSGSPASRAGLRPGMRILSIDGRPTTSLQAIEEALDETTGIMSLKIQSAEQSARWLTIELSQIENTEFTDPSVSEPLLHSESTTQTL